MISTDGRRTLSDAEIFWAIVGEKYDGPIDEITDEELVEQAQLQNAENSETSPFTAADIQQAIRYRSDNA